MNRNILFLIGILFLAISKCEEKIELAVTEEMVERVKSINKRWGMYSYNENPYKNMTKQEYQNKLSAHPHPQPHKKHLPPSNLQNPKTPPPTFDSRDEWPKCISSNRYQGHCGACWAFAASSVLSDRLCIQENKQVTLSPQYLVSCDKESYGCNGGYPMKALQFLYDTGTVLENCFPYQGKDVECISRCKNFMPMKMYKCIHSPTAVYEIEEMREAIYSGGPIQTSFEVFEDFRLWNGEGIYHHVWGDSVGWHSVRVIGWGVDGVEYWLTANSWGPGWGDNGFIKIEQGECSIDVGMYYC